jgi:hypothetical protein
MKDQAFPKCPVRSTKFYDENQSVQPVRFRSPWKKVTEAQVDFGQTKISWRLADRAVQRLFLRITQILNQHQKQPLVKWGVQRLAAVRFFYPWSLE